MKKKTPASSHILHLAAFPTLPLAAVSTCRFYSPEHNCYFALLKCAGRELKCLTLETQFYALNECLHCVRG